MVERYDRPLPLQTAAPRLGDNKRPEFEHMLACKMSSESGTLKGHSQLVAIRNMGCEQSPLP